jgi:hypothetical protein
MTTSADKLSKEFTKLFGEVGVLSKDWKTMMNQAKLDAQVDSIIQGQEYDGGWSLDLGDLPMELSVALTLAYGKETFELIVAELTNIVEAYKDIDLVDGQEWNTDEGGN